MSHQAWRMPVTLTGNHTARHSQQHAHPGSPCSSKPDCPVAKGMLEGSHRRFGPHVCFFMWYPHNWCNLTAGLAFLLAPDHAAYCVWHSLWPYGSKASCRITCWLFLVLSASTVCFPSQIGLIIQYRDENLF